jgi:hypothetical protein
VARIASDKGSGACEEAGKDPCDMCDNEGV